MNATLAPEHIRKPRALSGAQASPYHLSQEQIDFYDENGYLIIRKAITGELLKNLQTAGLDWIEQAKSHENDKPTGPIHPNQADGDFNFANRSNGKRVPFRVNYLHGKGQPASLETLGSPQILAIAESLCGRNVVPTYESMVFKMPGDGEIIRWHQDAVFPRNYRIFNIDIYLDQALKNTGALRVIPRSHRETHEVCGFAEKWGWNHPDQIIVEMEAGDILVHDDMVLHGSPYTENNPLRRVVYYEFRPIEQILDEGPWDMTWADQRLRLIPLALKRFQDAHPRHPQFQWNIEEKYRPKSSDDEETELRIVHTVHTPGSYCSANSGLQK
jgi:ectoine hydroxylase-related dioxygenase (phytanoyl-CoA dioxygenase family)